MAKKNKVIYLEAPHKYNFGSFMQGIESGKGLGKFGSSYAGLSSGMQGALGGLGNVVGQLGGSAISNGYETTAGSIVSGLGGVASAIPGPWGAIAGAGLGIVGGLINAAFGVKEDKEKHQRLDQATNYLREFNSNATTFDEVTGPQAVSLDSSVYTGGWFSKGKAWRKNQELAKQAQEALDKANRDTVNNITTLTKNQMNDLEGSYFAFGGPLDFGLMPIDGAISYELAQRRLAQKDLEIEAKRAFGGPLHTHGADWTNGITVIDNGGSHESNPFEGVPMGIAPDGQPNLVEEGEVIFNDYVFSNRLRVPKAVREKYKLRGTKDMTFADAAKKAQKESEERPNDPISKRGLEDIMGKLTMEQEELRNKKHSRAKSSRGHKYAEGDYLYNWNTAKKTPYEELQETPAPWLTEPVVSPPSETIVPYRAPETPKTSATEKKDKWKFPTTALRYAPALGAGIGVLTDLMGLTNKPDYSNANSIINTANQIAPIEARPIGNYLTYKPFDRLFYANQLGAQAAATRRAITNNSGGNRAAAIANLLAADYNAQIQLGNLYRQAEEYNLAQRERVETFNRGTNMFNAENDLKAQIANSNNSRTKVDAAIKAAAIRDQVDARVSAARSANLTNLFDSLGEIGREAASRNMILSNPALYYSVDSKGNVTYKNGYDTLSDAAKDEVNRHAAAKAKAKTKAYGGYLTIRRRR